MGKQYNFAFHLFDQNTTNRTTTIITAIIVIIIIIIIIIIVVVSVQTLPYSPRSMAIHQPDHISQLEVEDGVTK